MSPRHAKLLGSVFLAAALAACGGGSSGNREPVFRPTQPLAAGPQTCTGLRAADFACDGIDLARRMAHSAIGGGSGNDIWGWVDPLTGQEYALVGRSNGTAFIDVTNPLAPVFVGNLPTATTSSVWRDIKVYQDHAYIVADGAGAHGMQIFDLTRLRTSVPPAQFVADAVYGDFENAHNLAINEVSGFAYAVGTNTCNEGLHMIDISTPLAPLFAGCAEFGDTHDAHCVNYAGPDLAHAGREICVDSDSSRINVVDVTNKGAPFLLGTLTYPQLGFVHQGWLTEDHRYFLLGDELDELNFNVRTRTHVIDLLDLDLPVYVGRYTGALPSTDHNLYVLGNRVFEANYTSGLRVLEVVNLGSADFSEIAYFDTFPSNDVAGFSGAWSVYPYLPSGTIIVNDTDNGLFVLTFQ